MSAEVGARLVAERERLGLSQQEFFRACGISKAQQYNFEKGVNIPGGAYLIAASALGVDIQYVLTGQRAGQAPAPPPLPRDEADLLALYRASSEAGRRAIRATSLAVEKSLPAVDTPAGRGKKSA